MHLTATAAPLACVAASAIGTSRARKDARLAAVLAEFGYSTYVATGGEDEVWLDERARLVVCDLVSPSADRPVEVALAATRGVEVIVLVPHGVAIEGIARELLDACDATVIRYDGVEPHRVLHQRLLD